MHAHPLILLELLTCSISITVRKALARKLVPKAQLRSHAALNPLNLQIVSITNMPHSPSFPDPYTGSACARYLRRSSTLRPLSRKIMNLVMIGHSLLQSEVTMVESGLPWRAAI
jgi:hypothetical protein